MVVGPCVVIIYRAIKSKYRTINGKHVRSHVRWPIEVMPHFFYRAINDNLSCNTFATQLCESVQ